jgi:hypothetical protein
MRNNFIVKLAMNTLFYLLLAFSFYLLYSPLNHHKNNKASSAVQFVYQQF